MSTQKVFIEKFNNLAPEFFLHHFLAEKSGLLPILPRVTDANLVNAKKIVENRFDIIGEEVVLPDRFSWKQNPSRDKEWQIAHHKFYFAIDLIHAYRHYRDEIYLRKWISLLDSWLDEMGSGHITLSDAQVEAKRIEHWVYSFILLREADAHPMLSVAFLRKFLERIATETLYITEHLKPVRNHRTFQLFTVFLVGVLFPELSLHSYFLELGKEKLTENLLTDFLPDGVHVERSTHYHQLVLEAALSFIELAKLSGIRVETLLLERIQSALEFSMFMQWPNGEIPLINDSDNGDHLELLRRGADLFRSAPLLWAATSGRSGKPPEVLSKHFHESGYFIFSDRWGEAPDTYTNRQHIFYDCAGLGEGSHSHYDLFSFCYYVNGEPAVIDPGRYTYSSDPGPDGIDWRKRFKSTAYHNTVTIDSSDQTRYLSRTKHGPDVEIADKDFWLGKKTDWVSARAKSVEYAPLHKRVFIYMLREYLFIFDQIDMEDGRTHECALHFHLSEKLFNRVLLEKKESEVVVQSPLVEIRSYRTPGMESRIEPGWTSRRYGVKTEAPVVTLTQKDPEPLFFCSVLTPRQKAGNDLSIESFNLRTRPSDKILLFRVDGVREGESFVDRFIFQRGIGVETFQLEGTTFHGRFLAFRQDRHGKMIHLFAQKAEQIEIAGGPDFNMNGARNIEWSYGA